MKLNAYIFKSLPSKYKCLPSCPSDKGSEENSHIWNDCQLLRQNAFSSAYIPLVQLPSEAGEGWNQGFSYSRVSPCWQCLPRILGAPRLVSVTLHSAQKKNPTWSSNSLFWPLNIKIVDTCDKRALIWLANKVFLLIYQMLEHWEEGTKVSTQAEAPSSVLALSSGADIAFSMMLPCLLFTWKLGNESFLEENFTELLCHCPEFKFPI